MFTLKTNDPIAIGVFKQIFFTVINYLQEQSRTQGGIDILDDEILKPIEGTTSPGELEIVDASGYLNRDAGLIEIDDDSDDDSTEDNSSSGGVPSAYWSPACGNIHILTTETATAIANLTDCMLYKEVQNRRVRLMNGNIHLALEKLQKLEPLLVRTPRPFECYANVVPQEELANHQASVSSSVDVNFLSLSSQIPGTGVRYAPAIGPPYAGRIIVAPALEA